MIKILAIGTVALALSSSSLCASQISGGTQSAGPTSFDYGDGSGDPTIALTFSKFNNVGDGWILNDIQFVINGTVYDSYTVKNTNGGPKNYSVITTATLQLISTDSSVTFSETIPTHTLPINGLAGTTCNPTANPGCNVSTGSDTATGTGTAIYDGVTGTLTSTSGTAASADLSSPIDIAAFEGAGTFTLNVLGTFNGSVSGPANQSTTLGSGSESVTILYDYTAPEPSTMLLFGSALLGIGFFARKRVKH